MTGRYAVIGCKLKQNANEGCNSCASLAGLVLSFIACFILLVIAPLCAASQQHLTNGHEVRVSFPGSTAMLMFLLGLQDPLICL